MTALNTDWSSAWLGACARLSTAWAEALEVAAGHEVLLSSLRLQRGHLKAEWQASSGAQTVAFLWRPLGPGIWTPLLRAWRRHPDRSSALASGSLPLGVVEDLRARRQRLFPRKASEVLASCDCGGSAAAPCLHLGVLCRLAAERFGAQPLDLLHLRGLEPAVLEAALTRVISRQDGLETRPRRARISTAPPVPTDPWSDPLSVEDRRLLRSVSEPDSGPALSRWLAEAPSYRPAPLPGGLRWWPEGEETP